MVSAEGIAMEQRKVDAIKELLVPKSVRDAQLFLELANYYRKFVRGRASIMALLTDLLHKELLW